MQNVDRAMTNDLSAESGGTPSQGREETLTELTRCLSDAYVARGRMRLERGEFSLALSDLDDAIRQAADSTEAHRLRDLVHERKEADHQIQVAEVQTEPFHQAQCDAIRIETQFLAGYVVMARYESAHISDQPLSGRFPLGAEGRLAAIEEARRLCRDESRQQRQNLYDAYWTQGEEFDAIVTEFRSLTREVHLEKALDEGPAFRGRGPG
jgi:hypothetical protein